MSLIDDFDGEQKRIYRWASERVGTDYLQQDWQEERDSYFEPFHNEQNVHRYGFGSLNDLIKQLDSLWEDEKYMRDILRVCAVSAYRNKPEKETEQSGSVPRDKGTGEIPDFIYVF